MAFLFWFFLLLIVYCFFGYPALLWGTAKIARRPVHKSAILPSVSIVLSVWNEEDVIEGKIKNLLSLDYPADKIEIIIGSDGSDDRTNAIIKSIRDPRLSFIERNDRRGKMATINELVAKAKSEVIVFNDARQDIEKNAVRELVANLADPAVGCVSGELIFHKREGGTAKGINLYWHYEKFMRDHEARIHSMLGATGAIYAIRKQLFRPVPSNIVLDDMYIPFKIIEQGYRAVFDAKAHAYDQVADDPKEEYRRKARTLYGNFQMFKQFAHMFNPVGSPIAIQFFSHKFLRILVPFLMVALLIINLFLVGDHVFQWILAAQILFYTMAGAGALLRNRREGMLLYLNKLCYIPYVFCLLNFSVFIGFWRFIRSQQESTWQKARAK